MMTAKVSRDSRRSSTVLLLQSDRHFTLAYNSVKSTIYMDYLWRWVVEEHQWVTVQNHPLFGSQLCHWNVTLYSYTL